MPGRVDHRRDARHIHGRFHDGVRVRRTAGPVAREQCQKVLRAPEDRSGWAGHPLRVGFRPLPQTTRKRGLGEPRTGADGGGRGGDAGSGAPRPRARQALVGAEAVLNLRALRASRDFDAYWDFLGHRFPRGPLLSRLALGLPTGLPQAGRPAAIAYAPPALGAPASGRSRPQDIGALPKASSYILTIAPTLTHHDESPARAGRASPQPVTQRQPRRDSDALALSLPRVAA